MPSQAILYLANANVVSSKQHLADNSSMAIALVVINCHLFFENQSREILFRHVAEGLPFLGDVNSGKTDFVLSA